uniref:Uncharacterized protein n=1 Tax=Schistosoma haematobium TaxID=6185 RepID=A0A095C788_SCHHA
MHELHSISEYTNCYDSIYLADYLTSNVEYSKMIISQQLQQQQQKHGNLFGMYINILNVNLMFMIFPHETLH